jgi:hypothetical protein
MLRCAQAAIDAVERFHAETVRDVRTESVGDQQEQSAPAPDQAPRFVFPVLPRRAGQEQE